MFDISENGKEALGSYLKKTFGNKILKKPEHQKDQAELDRVIPGSRLQNLILTKSLIVKL